jgi:hypothetical protein
VPCIGAKVARARALLQSQAEEYVRLHMNATKKALEDGSISTAIDASQWALKHMQDTDESGKTVRVIERDVDAQADQQGVASGVTVNFGVALGGMPQQKALPAVKEVKD